MVWGEEGSFSGEACCVASVVVLASVVAGVTSVVVVDVSAVVGPEEGGGEGATADESWGISGTELDSVGRGKADLTQDLASEEGGVERLEDEAEGEMGVRGRASPIVIDPFEAIRSRGPVDEADDAAVVGEEELGNLAASGDEVGDLGDERPELEAPMLAPELERDKVAILN